MLTNEAPLDANLAVADFEKMLNNQLSHVAFEAADSFRKKNNRLPGPWNKQDAEEFLALSKDISKRFDLKPDDWTLESYETKFFYLFSFTC